MQRLAESAGALRGADNDAAVTISREQYAALESNSFVARDAGFFKQPDGSFAWKHYTLRVHKAG